MSQREDLLNKFNLHGYVLTTADFAQDPKLSCEYRRLLCELRETHLIVKTRLKDNLFQYELKVPDATGQIGLL